MVLQSPNIKNSFSHSAKNHNVLKLPVTMPQKGRLKVDLNRPAAILKRLAIPQISIKKFTLSLIEKLKIVQTFSRPFNLLFCPRTFI